MLDDLRLAFRLLRKNPGFTIVAVLTLALGISANTAIFGREGEARTWPEISVRRITAGYFRTVGLALLGGRALQESDGTVAPSVLLINEAAARRFSPGQNPLGAQIRLWGAPRTIVGVVANEKFHGLSQAAPLAVYLPLAQAPSVNGAGVLLVRWKAASAAQVSSLRTVIREIDPELAVFGIEPLEETVSRSISRQSFTMVVLVLFAIVALLLAAIGIHGVLSYSVARRTREIGIRMALGARPGRILRLVIGEGLVLTLLGLAIGLGSAVALTRLLSSLLFGIGANDPATFLVVALFLGSIALAAAYVPARRATQVDPATALRME